MKTIFFAAGMLLAVVMTKASGLNHESPAALRKKADSLFDVKYTWVRVISSLQFNEWLGNAQARWKGELDGADLDGETRHSVEVYGKVKMFRAKYIYLVDNPWANLHQETLSDWMLEGQTLEDPALAQLDEMTAYDYVGWFLAVKFSITRISPVNGFNQDWIDGSMQAWKYLLQSSCPDNLKFAYVNTPLSWELKRHHISPEVRILEPYLRKGFADPALQGHFDSLLDFHHRLDIGQPAPDFALHDYNGRTVRLSDLRGKKVVIDLWATWCSICLEKMPAYDSIARANKDPNIVFLSVSIDDDVDPGGVSMSWRKFIPEHHKDPTHNLNGPAAELAAFRAAYGIGEAPHFFVFDKDGKILTLECVDPLDPEFLRALKG